jgi:hypothetical protein
MPSPITPEGHFAAALDAQINKRRMSVRKLAEKTDSTYEHMRKLARGLALPSRKLINSIAVALSWDADEATQFVVADKIQKNYGAVPIKISGQINVTLKPFVNLIPQLTDEQRKMFLEQMRAIIRMNRRP